MLLCQIRGGDQGKPGEELPQSNSDIRRGTPRLSSANGLSLFSADLEV